MSRFKRVIHGAASSYGALVSIALYSLASVPLALHYLTEEQFALWALLTTITNYLGLIDLGMSSALARLLIDHKDERQNGVYGGLVRTGMLVLLTQGTIVFAIGFIFAPLFCGWLDIDFLLQKPLIDMVRWQSAILGFGFIIRIFGQLLYAHQRLDIANYVSVATTIVSYVALWFFFQLEQGIFSLIWANLIVAVGGGAALFIACWKLGLLPSAGQWGQISWQRFKEIFEYGKDMFLVALGTQLIMASQTIIITRTLGLKAAATWAIGTKMFNLISQAIWRISDVSAPAFSEMIVRKEQKLLRDRYKSMVTLTASLSGFAAVSYVLCNSLFVPLWTHGKISWPATNDLLLAVWMVILALLHCHNGFVLLTKKIDFMRYIYFVEGIVFISLAGLLASWGGLPAIIISSIFCSTIFSGAYGIWRISNFFDYPLRQVAFAWLKPMSKVLAWYVPIAFLTWWGSGFLHENSRLAFNAIVCGSLGLFLFLRHGISSNFQIELLHRTPEKISPLLRRIFTTPTK